MAIPPINNNNSTTVKLKRICLGGMTTGASVFLASSAINAIMTVPSESAKEISEIAKRTGKLGLAFSVISAFAGLGTILYGKA